MLRRLRPFLLDESGKLADYIVSAVLVVIIAGGVLIAVLAAAQRIWDPLRAWLCAHLTLFCR